MEWENRKIDESELLKVKLQSKVAVSTFLAGFFIAAHVELVKDPEKLAPAGGTSLAASMRIVATVCFTVALGLLLVAVFIYDRLAMPRAFWQKMPEPKKPKASDHGKFAQDFRQYGPVYAYMVRTWRYIFMPGVGLGVIGFLALLVPTYECPSGLILIALCLSAVAGSIWVFRLFAPDGLGVD